MQCPSCVNPFVERGLACKFYFWIRRQPHAGGFLKALSFLNVLLSASDASEKALLLISDLESQLSLQRVRLRNNGCAGGLTSPKTAT